MDIFILNYVLYQPCITPLLQLSTEGSCSENNYRLGVYLRHKLRVALPLDLDTHSWSPDKVATVPYLTLPYIKLYYVTLACESKRNIFVSEIMWNANLMQQGNFIDKFLARHVSGT